MKSKLLSMSLFAMAILASCTKESVVAITDLTGVWVSDNQDIQFTIHDTRGKGEISFTDLKKDDGRYLKTNFMGSFHTYKIQSVTDSDMMLTDTASIHFNKISAW